jgi:hypothetical protein
LNGCSATNCVVDCGHFGRVVAVAYHACLGVDRGHVESGERVDETA